MKMDIFKDKKSKNSSRLNIHFGKIILIMLLILGQVLTVNANKVEAGEAYTWKKYNAINGTATGERTLLFKQSISNEYNYYSIGSKVMYYNERAIIRISGRIFSTGFDKTFSIPLTASQLDSLNNNEHFIKELGASIESIVNYKTTGTQDVYATTTIKYSTKGAYIEEVVGNKGDFPIRGVHSDGFWYELNQNETTKRYIYKKYKAFPGDKYDSPRFTSGEDYFNNFSDPFISGKTVRILGKNGTEQYDYSVNYYDFPTGTTLLTKYYSLENYGYYLNFGWEIAPIRGAFMSEVEGIDGEYPNNNIHSDGFWYIKDRIANTNPTLTVNLPEQNSYFSKINQA